MRLQIADCRLSAGARSVQRALAGPSRHCRRHLLSAGTAMGCVGLLLAVAVPAAAQRVAPIRPPQQSSAVPPSTNSTRDVRDAKTAPTTPISMDEYVLGPGDKLRIEVYKDAQLSQSVQIRPDGKITLPLVGDIEATAKTPLELRDTATKVLREYMTSPVVTVSVAEPTAAVAHVCGDRTHTR